MRAQFLLYRCIVSGVSIADHFGYLEWENPKRRLPVPFGNLWHILLCQVNRVSRKAVKEYQAGPPTKSPYEKIP